MNQELDDYDLFVKARQGDLFSYTSLHVRYLNFSHVLVKTLMHQNSSNILSEDELVAAAMFAFQDCFESYTGGRDGFYHYWRESAYHAVIKEMVDTSKYYALHETSFDEEDYYGRLNTEKYGEMDESIHFNITKKEIDKAIDNNYPNFTKMEKKIFIRKYRYGETTNEIVKKLNISVSSVNRHYKKALDKFTAFIKEHY